MTKRAYKYRFYPTEEQEIQLAQSFGCARKVYNHFLDYHQTQYDLGNKTYYGHWASLLPDLKTELEYLKDVSSVVLQQSLRHLDTAFKNWFARMKQKRVVSDNKTDPYGKPKFKSKHHKNSITYMKNAFKYIDGNITLAKQKQPLDIRWSRKLSGIPSQVVVSKTSTNKYYISILVEEDIETKVQNGNAVGIDVGLNVFGATSDGELIPNPKFYRSMETKLGVEQKKFARNKKESNRRTKQKRIVASIHERIANSRNDFLHKLSTRLINENQIVICEDLNVKGMQKNRRLAKSIGDVGWGSFISMLKYKAEWYGRTFHQIDRWFPSSKTCHVCHHKVDKMPLHIREWTCPECNTHHDRDINASINILNEGLAGLVRHVKCPSDSIPSSSVNRRKKPSNEYNGLGRVESAIIPA